MRPGATSKLVFSEVTGFPGPLLAGPRSAPGRRFILPLGAELAGHDQLLRPPRRPDHDLKPHPAVSWPSPGQRAPSGKMNLRLELSGDRQGRGPETGHLAENQFAGRAGAHDGGRRCTGGGGVIGVRVQVTGKLVEQTAPKK